MFHDFSFVDILFVSIHFLEYLFRYSSTKIFGLRLYCFVLISFKMFIAFEVHAKTKRSLMLWQKNKRQITFLYITILMYMLFIFFLSIFLVLKHEKKNLMLNLVYLVERLVLFLPFKLFCCYFCCVTRAVLLFGQQQNTYFMKKHYKLFDFLFSKFLGKIKLKNIFVSKLVSMLFCC